MERKILDWEKPQKVEYCIPIWLRDEQIKSAIKRVTGRIQPLERTEDPIAIVCFGPSLQKTWEKIKDFKYVMSMSGSTKFLLKNGIVPTWHTAVDPREDQIKLLGEPDKRIEYLISSTCHPKFFDHLKDCNVKLWHVFDATEDGQRLIPAGEWALTGGCDIGLRSLAIASFLGFRNLHIFGMDHSAGTIDLPTEKRHAGEHPDKTQHLDICEYEGIKYLTTQGMLEAARQLFHELDQLPAINPIFYGEGLAQHMAKNWKPKLIETKKSDNIVGFCKPELISNEYKILNERLHSDNLAYGAGGAKHSKIVMDLVIALKTNSVLDYGCGKSLLAKSLPFPIWEYDPAIKEKSEPPRPADLVVCTDVLEHIEPDKLIFVLDDIRRCLKQIGYFVIHTGPSTKKLSDGRNAHLIQKDYEWWKSKISKFFTIAKVWTLNPELHFIVAPKIIKSISKVDNSFSLRKRSDIRCDEVLKVVIGGIRKDRIPALVAGWSVKKNATCPVEIIHTWDKDLPKRPCPTGFSFVRFQVPQMAGYQGRGLYIDSDQIVYGDVKELLEAEMSGCKVLRPKNQTAVLLWDCNLVKFDISQILEAWDKGETDYNKLLWELWPLQKNDIGYLPDEWNLTDTWRDNGKLLHYTKVATQPWSYEKHPLGYKWHEALVGAINDGDITIEMLEEDKKLGYIKTEMKLLSIGSL